MLLKVSAANFKSFNEAVTLDLVSSTKVRSLASHVVSLGEMKILRNAAIYGANASGKTNLYRILRFLQDSLRNGRIPLGTGDWFCKLFESNKEKETILDIQYETKGRFFDYGFSALLADRRIVSEWLYELSPSGKRWNAQVVFERYEDSSPVIGDIENLSNDEKSRFEVYAGDFPLKSDKLFFSELNRGKTYLPDSALGVLPVAFDCLVSGLRVIGAGESRARFDSFLKDDYLEKASRLLSGFDTGIKQIKKKSLSLAELRDLVPEPIFRDMEEAVTKGISLGAKGSINGTLRLPGALIVIENFQSQEPDITKICLLHCDSPFDYEFEEESDGTRRLFDFMELLLTSGDGVVFVVDEIDRSLHPMLTRHLLELFNEIHKEDSVQLIFTTHEDVLMDKEYLRKDEIWFVDRKEELGSSLYSLDRFAEVRSDTSIDKNYWNGRYGGVPVLSSSPFAERGRDASAE